MAPGINLRPPAVSASFYPADASQLQLNLQHYFSQTKTIKPPAGKKKLKALIVPHAGYLYSGLTAAWGFRQLNLTKTQHFVLLGPSHHACFAGLAAAASKFWLTPLGKINHAPPKKFLNDLPHQSEHCLEVQLPFLQFLYHRRFSFTAFLTGQLDASKMARYLLTAYPRSIFLISSDLSHYLPLTVAKTQDQLTIKAILNLNAQYFNLNDNAACGATAIQILINLAKTASWQPQSIYYDTSATASGDHQQVVGYASLGFYE